LKEMPPVLTREDFITVYKLEGDGTNPHRIKKDEVKEDSVSDLFGRRCGKQGRAGYRWADCKNPRVLGRVKHLHPILYQHAHDAMPPFLKIKFAQGIAMEENGKKVDWAGFGQETNQTQCSRIEGLRKKLVHCKNAGLEVSKDSWKKVKVEKGKASDSRMVNSDLVMVCLGSCYIRLGFRSPSISGLIASKTPLQAVALVDFCHLSLYCFHCSVLKLMLNCINSSLIIACGWQFVARFRSVCI
jgi:hypothetical protein